MADALSRFPQRSQAKKNTFRDENFQIFYYLQASLIKATIVKLSISGLTVKKGSTNSVTAKGYIT